MPPALYHKIRERAANGERGITAEAVHLLKAAAEYEEVMVRPSLVLGTPPKAMKGELVDAKPELF